MRPSYPYFWGPKDHRLFRYYQRLNRLAFVVAPVVIVVNEFLLRPKLIAQKLAPNSFFEYLVLILNAQLSGEVGFFLHLVLSIFSIIMVCVFVMQPKWASFPYKRALKSRLPTYSDYLQAHFYIENSNHSMSFFVWHHLLMWVALFIGFIIPCVALNLLRGI